MIDTKLIASDLDDTLLDSSTKLSDENIAALRKCAEKGIHVVLCSGRIESSIMQFVRQLNISETKFGKYIIATNGCTIFDTQTQKHIFVNKLSPEILIRADELAREAGLSSQVYSADTIYYDNITPWMQLNINICKVNSKKVDDYKSFLQKGSPKMLIACNPKTPQIVQGLMQKMKAEFAGKAEVFTSKPFFLEVLPLGCGKGQALEWLCNHLGISMKNAMGFGDGMNDETMIRLCGHGVAMKNADDYLKSVADYVTDFDNNESGVGRFIEKYVL